MKNARKTISIIMGITVILCAVILCCIFIPLPKPSEIYKNSLYSIVELKASTENVGESFGTAEFIDDEGTLVTNAHVVTYTRMGVVNTFSEYFIRFATEDEYREVSLVKYDSDLDIAVLKLIDKNGKFSPLKVGESSTLDTGDTIYAIGNGVNYGLSMAQGIVGIPLLEIEYSGNVRKVIQCDLTIAEGNSGGALLDSRGRLVGITTFRTKDGMGNVVYGLAYCIPIDIVMEYVRA